VSLKQLLERKDVLKVGVNAKNDVTRIQSSLDVTFNGVVNLPAFAVQRKAVHKSNMPLAEMVHYFLGEILPKPKVKSSWSNCYLFLCGYLFV
jgi:hypothetical protein